MINLIPVAGINDNVITTMIVTTTTIMTTIISTMVTPMIGTINANGHNRCKSKPGRIIPVIIRRIIGHVGW
jgi:hypothetical protein